MLVVGAGVAGLTAAELLSRRGFDVPVLEKNPMNPAGKSILPISLLIRASFIGVLKIW
ncbi:MAG: NAD(P)/FAD-dependent oxidoreductase [Anaerotruncus sp.]|nr:MAG: NAD(P)/FAD-dependent oxidoreductase [Anaerotruncus sp.]